MTMRTYHGALLLILALVMAVLSTGICTAPVPAPTPTPAPAPISEEPPPTKLTCLKVLANSGCDRKACHGDCFMKLKGNGFCFFDQCWCSYTCKSPLLPPSPARSVAP